HSKYHRTIFVGASAKLAERVSIPSQPTADLSASPGPSNLSTCIIGQSAKWRKIMNTPFDTNAERQAIITEIRRFVDREVIPVAHNLEHNDTYPLDLIDKLKRLGIFAATIPETYGGLGFDLLTYVQIIEELSRGWMSLAG